ncbi:tetratricopeptide repeat protein [Pontibacillus salicampi]|uniref:Tetratricopeptide repeat protein n=1 Tax=Pontibacillus salicampi TaxID=1449801 RepID=A0ABV6LT63_9BACI
MQNSTKSSRGAMHPNVIPFTPEGDFYFSQGVRAFQRREFEKAIKWLTRAIEFSPKQPLYQCQLSVVHTETGNYHSANQVLMNVLAEFGHEYVDCYYLIANNYAHLGLFHDAKKYARDYLQKAPEGDFKDEAQELLNMVDIEDEDEEEFWEEEDELMRYQESAFYYMERQEWQEALPLLEEMSRLFPDYVSAKHDYATALFFSGERLEAIELEEQWKKEHPSSLHSVCNLAIFYHHAGKKEKAAEHIHALENVYPINEQQQLKVAVTLAQVGCYTSAHERFIGLPKARLKGHLSYYKWFSITAYHMGEPSRALRLWEEGCLRHPSLSEQGGPWQDS